MTLALLETLISQIWSDLTTWFGFSLRILMHCHMEVL